jgi:hypothetical protein
VEPLALPIRARFVPLHGRPDCSPDWCMPRIPVARFYAVLLALDGRLVLLAPAAGAGFRISPRHPIEAAPRRSPSARRPPVVVEYSAAGLDLGFWRRHDRHPCASRWPTGYW